mgnify:CR=1 FL=1
MNEDNLEYVNRSIIIGMTESEEHSDYEAQPDQPQFGSVSSTCPKFKVFKLLTFAQVNIKSCSKSC